MRRVVLCAASVAACATSVFALCPFDVWRGLPTDIAPATSWCKANVSAVTQVLDVGSSGKGPWADSGRIRTDCNAQPAVSPSQPPRFSQDLPPARCGGGRH